MDLRKKKTHWIWKSPLQHEMEWLIIHASTFTLQRIFSAIILAMLQKENSLTGMLFLYRTMNYIMVTGLLIVYGLYCLA